MRTAILILTLTLPIGAHAGIEDTYGLGSRATALGNAMTALADDFSATFYNPAGLALTDHARDAEERQGIDLHLGFFSAQPQLTLERARIDGGALVFDQGLGPVGSVPHDVRDSTGLTIGAGFDLGRIVGLRGIHLGIALYMPVSRAFQWDIIGGEQLQWPLYLDRTQRMSILPALALRPHPKVAIGLGARVTVDAQTNTEAVLIPQDDGRLDAELGNAATIGARAAPTVGVLVEPTSWLRIGVSVRGALNSEDFGYTDLDATALPGLASFGYTHYFSHYYSPLEVAVGLAARPTGWLHVVADVTWSRWSAYIDSNHDNYGGLVANDIVTPRLGLELQAHRSTAVLAGYTYQASPFDNGGSWTNFVDNDKHVASLGTQTDLGALIAGWPPVRVSWHAQVHVLRAHREIKDWTAFQSADEADANPGWPGWRSSGWILNVGLSLDAAF